ncbi:MAG: M16 family metallopeptidase [Planctomycetota bacterium]|jgi:zinc protease
MERNRKFKIFVLVSAFLLPFFGIFGCADQYKSESPVKVAEKQQVQAGKYDYRHIELDNGLDVITLEDFSCPIVAVQIWYHVGSKNEDPNRQGFAHMFEHMMFRGTDKLGPMDHFGYLRRVGGTTNGYTSFDRTVYLETVPADQLELALWLEAERMTFLKIDQEAFDTERKVVEEERRKGLNQPYGTLIEQMLPELFSVHPYRWPPIGNIAHLRASSVQELRDFWTKYYTPSNATLIIVGAAEHEKGQELAKKYFGWIPRYDEPAKVTVKEPVQTEARSVEIKEDNAPAPGVGVVYRTVPFRDEDTTALDLLTEILGGGNSSRLYRELVAQKQMAVAAQSFMWSLEQDGLLAAGAVMPPFGSDANSVLSIIEGHIERLRNERVTDRELTKAKNQMLRGEVTQNLKIESKARTIGHAAIEIGDVSYVNRQIENIRKVTADDIMRVAKTYLKPERAVRISVKRNLMGGLLSRLKKEEQYPITAKPETNPPKPGRAGVKRPGGYPTEPPLAKIQAAKLTPDFKSRILDNGLKVLVVPNREVPFITVQLGILNGAWTENKAGTAAMTMRMLTKGTSRYSEAELADELETYAISLSGSGGMDTSSVVLSCLTEQIERGMDLMGEVVFEPTFPEEEFFKLRKQILTSLAVSSAEPDYIAERELRQQMYGEHPYSRTATGEIEDVNGLKVSDLQQWWKRFSRPDSSVLIFAGDINENKAYELAVKTFGGWKADEPKPAIKLPEIAQPSGTHIYIVDKPGSTQSQIRAAQPGITRRDDGYFVSRLVSNYFGWAFNSRLNEVIRVQKGLTYGAWGGFTARRFAGDFKIGTFTKTETTGEA